MAPPSPPGSRSHRWPTAHQGCARSAGHSPPTPNWASGCAPWPPAPRRAAQGAATGRAIMGTRATTRARVLSIGNSQRGEPIAGLLLTRAAGTDPASLERSGRPTVGLIGQQHGAEPAGSEALLGVSSELAQGLLEPLLDRINVVVVPRANPDGAQ